ncbi:hypothetical protein ACIA8K_31230 [Catenuloplanes sp. NPDC051500]|uniref:hypothetical protein n=1 Tax=Catenuloplanes sp. NPDC051500 TaxID=3363959 RepID=UPI0037B7C9E5
MERRLLLAGVAAAGVAIGTPGIATAAPRQAKPLLEYGQDGGFVPAGWNELRAPLLVIYPDHTAIADARLRLRLGSVDRLLRQAVAVTADRRNGTLTLGPDDPQIADAPDTYFTTRVKGIEQHLSVYALETYREYHGYPAATYALYDALTALAARVRMRGERYRPDAIKLVASASEDGDSAADIRPWPAGVRVPVIEAGRWQVVEKRHGAEARQITRVLPDHEPSDWQRFRVPSGKILIVSYRRLLPHERGA